MHQPKKWLFQSVSLTFHQRAHCWCFDKQMLHVCTSSSATLAHYIFGRFLQVQDQGQNESSDPLCLSSVNCLNHWTLCYQTLYPYASSLDQCSLTCMSWPTWKMSAWITHPGLLNTLINLHTFTQSTMHRAVICLFKPSFLCLVCSFVSSVFCYIEAASSFCCVTLGFLWKYTKLHSDKYRLFII